MPVDPPVRPAGVAVDVVLLGVEDVLDGPAQPAEGDEELLVVARRAAQVRLAPGASAAASGRSPTLPQRRLAPELARRPRG